MCRFRRAHRTQTSIAPSHAARSSIERVGRSLINNVLRRVASSACSAASSATSAALSALGAALSPHRVRSCALAAATRESSRGSRRAAYISFPLCRRAALWCARLADHARAPLRFSFTSSSSSAGRAAQRARRPALDAVGAQRTAHVRAADTALRAQTRRKLVEPRATLAGHARAALRFSFACSSIAARAPQRAHRSAGTSARSALHAVPNSAVAESSPREKLCTPSVQAQLRALLRRRCLRSSLE